MFHNNSTVALFLIVGMVWLLAALLCGPDRRRQSARDSCARQRLGPVQNRRNKHPTRPKETHVESH